MSGLELPSSDQDEPIATIFQSPDRNGGPVIVPSDHSLLINPPGNDDQEDLEESEAVIIDDSMPDTSLFDDESDKASEFCEPEFCDPGLILPFATAAPIPEEEEDHGESHYGSQSGTESKGEEILSESMQSLVDGLMSWGGGLDTDEDNMALPEGMAASIVLEESTALTSSKLD